MFVFCIPFYLDFVLCRCLYNYAVLSDWETKNKYRVRNTLGQDIYFAAEGIVIPRVSMLCAIHNFERWEWAN